MTPLRLRLRTLSLILGMLLLVAFPAAQALAAAGDLDTSFSFDGKEDEFFGFNTGGAAIALQSNGKIVMVGSGDPPGGGTDQDFVVARYTAQGLLDTSFGGGDGFVTVAFPERPGVPLDDYAGAVAVSPTTDKIVVAGRAGKNFGVAYFTKNGAPDTSFDSDGRLSIDFDAGDDGGSALKIQPNGKYLVGGTTLKGGQSTFALARFNADGSPDTGFDGDGQVVTGFGTIRAGIFDLALTSTGKIVAVGDAGDVSSKSFAVARYLSDGSLDPAFSGDGKRTIGFGGDLEEGRSVVVQPSNGRLLVGGGTYTGGASKFAIARLLQGGGFDSTFDGDGKVTLEFGSTTNTGGQLAVQSDGKIVAAGYTNLSATSHDFAVARLNTFGVLDTGFGGGDGKVTTSFTQMSDFAHDVLVQPDDRIVVAGSSWTGAFALARYLPS